ncbi:MAG TPA: aminodeoxychorismate lyase [Sulfuricaulis sp.]|nr:aminodeoxychorismate lyase [Sulfuricaulis sp.]
MTLLVNGSAEGNVSALDRGFQYGDGIFETLAVENGEPLLWDKHLRRMHNGAARLGIQAPSVELLQHESGQVCRGASRGVLKIVITRGISERGYAPSTGVEPTRTVGLLPWPDYPAQRRTHGVSVQFCHTLISRHNRLAGLKHLNRLEQILGRMELKDDCAEGLMQDEYGHVIDGTMTNLFMVVHGSLITPDLTHSGVEGVMRAVVLENAAALSIPCNITVLTRADILAAEEIFLTNSLIGLWPVCRIQTREYPVGRITQRIQEAIRDAHIDY